MRDQLVMSLMKLSEHADDIEFTVDESKSKYSCKFLDIETSITREAIDDLIAYPVFCKLIGDSAPKDWNGYEMAIELIYENICSVEFYRLNTPDARVYGRYSHEECISSEFKAKAMYVACKFVKHIKKELT